MANPSIGSMRERITIQQEGSQTADSGGGYTQSWATFASDIPAKVEPASGAERIIGQKLAPIVSHAVTIRYLDGVTAGMRVAWGSKYLNIRAVINDEARERFMVLACEEGEAT